ncbi:hypothetical protein ElyMa_006844400 [Elysia marginata]|uniref:G-protein coupled receptors family 1 profile domain-containing protein n=1 Tax=Elysia marginata TaxID=1093978 RepID=A0AAV4J695_9GAST|nr:hypothetical protein ElyMa_006844400 [Elysia marginata]
MGTILKNKKIRFGTKVKVLKAYVWHRFTESMTVSLLGLSVADLIGLILLESFNVCVNPMFVRADIPFYPPEVQYITVVVVATAAATVVVGVGVVVLVVVVVVVVVAVIVFNSIQQSQLK